MIMTEICTLRASYTETRCQYSHKVMICYNRKNIGKLWHYLLHFNKIIFTLNNIMYLGVVCDIFVAVISSELKQALERGYIEKNEPKWQNWL